MEKMCNKLGKIINRFTSKQNDKNQKEQVKSYPVVDIFNDFDQVDLSNTVAFQNLLKELNDVTMFMDILEKRKQFVSPVQYTQDLLWAFDLANTKMCNNYGVIDQTGILEKSDDDKTIL